MSTLGSARQQLAEQPVRVDLRDRRVTVDDRPVELSAVEYTGHTLIRAAAATSPFAVAAPITARVLPPSVISATTATPPAYALVQHPDGSVTVTVHNLRTAIGPINSHLKALGIPVRFIPITDACPASNGGFVYPVKPSQYPQLRWTFTRAGSRKMAPDDWGYIGIGRSDAGRLFLAGGAMKPPLPPCFNSTLGKIASPSSSGSNLAAPQSGLFRPQLVQRARVV